MSKTSMLCALVVEISHAVSCMKPSIVSHLSYKSRNITVLLKRIFSFCCLAALVFIIYLATNTNRYGQQTSSANTTKIQFVLIWKPPYIWKQFDHDKTVGKLISGGGVDKQCIFTYDINFLLTVDKYDVILFNSGTGLWQSPTVRDVRQKYIFACHEPPVYSGRNLSYENNFYNITMTYRLDSDVLWPFGCIRDVETNILIAPAKNPKWRKADLENFVPSGKLQQLINGKNKSITWFVSKCNATSRRDELVMQLKKHINVDIFGRCLNGSIGCQYNSNECDETLDKEYKFYLSFENSHCSDYVTEKLFRALSRSIIPIVFGGANYSHFAPPHSYINAQDFTNVAELAKYLLYLEKNTTAYGEYFWWKSYYSVITTLSAEYFPTILTDLCYYLHKTSHQIQYYENIKDYFIRECNTDCYYWWSQRSCNKVAISLLN